MKILKTTIAALLFSASVFAQEATLTIITEGTGFRVKPAVTAQAGKTISSYKIIISYDGNFQSADGYTVVSNENGLLTLETVSWWAPTSYTSIVFANTTIEPVINGVYATLSDGEEIFIGDNEDGSNTVSLPGEYWLKNGANLITDNSAISGNVGIGTNAPTEKLEVAGKIKSDEILFNGWQTPSIKSNFSFKPSFYAGPNTDIVGFNWDIDNENIAKLSNTGKFYANAYNFKGWLNPSNKGDLEFLPSFFTGNQTDFIGFEWKADGSQLARLTHLGQLFTKGSIYTENDIYAQGLNFDGDLNPVSKGNISILPAFYNGPATSFIGLEFKVGESQMAYMTTSGTLKLNGSSISKSVSAVVETFGTEAKQKSSYFFDATDKGSANADVFFVRGDGAVGINTNKSEMPEGYKLAINGKIICEELKVQLSQDWPDYVFADDYKLMTLDSLQEFVDENDHLPNIPDAAEMKQNGVSVSEMNVKLMEKVEELTLYILKMNKEIEALKTIQKN